MPFLLDSDTFIEAKDDFYGFDFCPGYWDWLLRANGVGQIYSIDHVFQELIAGNDDLAAWVQGTARSLFRPMDSDALEAFKHVSQYVQNLPPNYTADKKRIFLGGADPLLIAYALAHSHTVATREQAVPADSSKIKLPNICQHFGVPTCRPCDMMRQLGVRLVLQ